MHKSVYYRFLDRQMHFLFFKWLPLFCTLNSNNELYFEIYFIPLPENNYVLMC